jgi:hypothetical protein
MEAKDRSAAQGQGERRQSPTQADVRTATAVTTDPRPHAGKDSKHRQSLLRIQCPHCERWYTETLEGRPRRHGCPW